MRTRRVAPACLLALAVVAAEVRADPIPVTTGVLSVTGIGTNAFFEFEGADFRAAGNLPPGVVGPDLTCFPCAAGDVIALDTTFEGSTGAGTATIDGTVFPLIGFSATKFLFEAPDVVAPGAAGSFTVTRSFTFSGRLSGFDVVDIHQTPIFEQLLTGRGVATASFAETPNPGGPALFSFHSVRYDFAQPAPVPEPATFLLAATGLGAALRLRKRAGLTSRQTETIGTRPRES